MRTRQCHLILLTLKSDDYNCVDIAVLIYSEYVLFKCSYIYKDIIISLVFSIFIRQHCASAVLAIVVCLSVRLSHVSNVSEQLNAESHKQCTQ